MVGPATDEAARESSSFEFPSTSSSRSTMLGRYDWYATSKNTSSVPAKKATM